VTYRLAALAALALAGGCAPALVRRGEVNEDALGAVRRRLPAIRGLAFTAPVRAFALDRDGLRATLAAAIEQSYHPGDLERLEAVYARLGLVPPGTSLRAALIRLYEEEGAGLYDPRTKRLMLATHAVRTGGWWVGLLSTLMRRDLVGEMLVAHELTHALQDQHWGVPTEPQVLTDADSDRLLARHALLEGDATLAGFAYLLGTTPDADTLAAIEERLHGVPGDLARRYPDVPEAVRATVAFQYDQGTAFAGRALASGGWAAVDRAQADPPASTEQVLHPARYFADRDPPRAVALGGTERLEATGWTPILEDTVGELYIGLLARRALAGEQAARVAEGWGGDRLRALTRRDELLLLWMTAWDSPDEGAEFADALAAILPDARVERRKARVLVLLGPPGDECPDLDALAADAWGSASGDGARVTEDHTSSAAGAPLQVLVRTPAGHRQRGP
jgi:hypothetical protein